MRYLGKERIGRIARIRREVLIALDDEGRDGGREQTSLQDVV